MSNKIITIIAIQVVVVIYLIVNNWHSVEAQLKSSNSPNKTATEEKETSMKKVKVLFIGNSYTAGNKMTDILSTLSKLQTQRKYYLETHTLAVGGATLETHWQNRNALKTIKSNDWDYIVFQGQSTIMMRRNGAELFDRYLNKFLLQINRHKTKVILFSTWPRQENNPIYSQSNITPYEMLTRIERSYYRIAKKYSTNVVYTGTPFYKINKAGINTYEGDGSHANKVGSFVTAMAFFKKFMPNTQIDCGRVNVNIGIEINQCETIKQILYPVKKVKSSN